MKALGPLEVLFLLVLLVAASRADDEYVPPALRRRQVPITGPVTPTPTPTPAPDLYGNPAAPLDEPYVPPAERRSYVVPRSQAPEPQGSGLLEKVRFLSSIEVGGWTGGRWRGKGTGETDGGVAISGTLPNGWKPTLLLGPRSLGGALGYSRAFAGGEVASGKVFAVVGIKPFVW